MLRVAFRFVLGRGGNEDGLGNFYHSRVNCCSSQLTVATGECGHTIIRTTEFSGESENLAFY